MMIHWANRHINLIANLFVAIFIGAITIHTLCDLEIIEYASNLSRISHTHDQSSHKHQEIDHHQVHELNNSIHHEKNEHNKTAEDECCDDLASNLYSSLYAKLVVPPVPTNKLFLIDSIELTQFILPILHVEKTIFHEYDDPPPLSGFDLRVIVQSFLN